MIAYFILLSANAFNLDQSTILSFGKKLTIYHTSLTIFFTHPRPNLHFLVTSILSSANALNLDQSKILLFGKQLKTSLQMGYLTLYHTILSFYNPEDYDKPF